MYTSILGDNAIITVITLIQIFSLSSTRFFHKPSHSLRIIFPNFTRILCIHITVSPRTLNLYYNYMHHTNNESHAYLRLQHFVAVIMQVIIADKWVQDYFANFKILILSVCDDIDVSLFLICNTSF